ncbi:MAG: anti-sigma F factor [Clostridia bacterium]|nr:anti-sigma F factor [Clostridia bacterium]
MNEMKLIFPSDSRNERFARYAVTAFVAQLDPTTEELADIRTAVSEAVTNGIIHGYRGTRGLIQVETRLYDNRTVVIVVKDKGHGIEDIEQARQPLFTTDGSGERGGMGFAIMESFSDKLTVRSKVGRGTTVTMTKRLS